MNAMVSIVIPVFNAEDYLAQSITSILSQTYPELEVLACDDKSTDNSLLILQSFNDSRLKVLTNDTNLGYLRTINKLMELASGDFIAFQDADDVSHPERIAEQINFLALNPSVGLVGTNFSTIDTKGKIKNQFNQLTDPAEISEQIMCNNPFQKPSILFRRNIYDTIGGFREGFLKLKNISEDYDWLLRASEKFALANINGREPLYFYRSVPTAMTKLYAHVNQNFGEKIAQYLATERRLNGIDSLEKGDWKALATLTDHLSLPYLADPSRFYYEKAEALLYSGLFKQAMTNSARAIFIQPFKLRNMKSFISCVKRWVKNCANVYKD